MYIPLPNGRELPLDPRWWAAFIVWGILTLFCRDWGRVRRARG